jgi:hypothetical protein
MGVHLFTDRAVRSVLAAFVLALHLRSAHLTGVVTSGHDEVAVLGTAHSAGLPRPRTQKWTSSSVGSATHR